MEKATANELESRKEMEKNNFCNAHAQTHMWSFIVNFLSFDFLTNLIAISFLFIHYRNTFTLLFF